MKLINFCFVVIATLLITYPLLTLAAAPKLTEVQYQGLFQEFTKRYGKEYQMNAFFKRFQLFKENLDFVMDWNADKSNSHVVGINFFADMAPEEWNQFKGLSIPADYKEPDFAATNLAEPEELKSIDLKALPTNFSWVEEKRVSPIRQQSSCGSCYSQAAVSTVETAYAIKNNTDQVPVLSVQQGVDCSAKWGNNGCGGGWMTNMYRYIIDAGGLCEEEDYPYKNKKGNCRAPECNKSVQITNFFNLSGHTEDSMKKAITINSLAIAITSNTREFMFYKSGIIAKCGTASSQIDHAVTLVGYGTSEAGTPYFTIRNSWGKTWGEEGYVRVANQNNNVCKLRSNVSYPIIQHVGGAEVPAA